MVELAVSEFRNDTSFFFVCYLIRAVVVNMGSSDPKLSSEDVTISSAGVIRGIEEVDEGNGWIVVGGEETDARDTISSSYSHMVESEFREYQALGNQQDSMTEVENNPTNSPIFCHVKSSCLCSLLIT